MSLIKERIKEQRLKNGLTLLQVAESIGVKEATVQRYESGEIKNIKHDTIEKLAQCLNCSPAYLMGWQDNPISVNSKHSAQIQRIISSLDRAGDSLKDEDINDIVDQTEFLIDYKLKNKK